MSRATTGGPAERGSQAERTTLAWTRTSFAFLGNGALLMIRDLHGSAGPVHLVPAALAGAIALGTFLIAVRRQRTLRQQPTVEQPAPRVSIHVIGSAVLTLVVVTAVFQLV
ncbi:DUF202 domain-containing protein [Mycobacterium parmense]|uniref:DUF202 domain-containing protein n=1 Tax=Mycobacterium parmense TaxID=185642 RepID=A0A7I7YNP6_9MYCO|nr:DUF202 domain-containing protein [Mycobacterium parmense]MCV7349847.1 DUF202 domain-containing protein [Mycobacterium parmense]ORW51021.1 hypothetical protein AWC20_23410 [Mycobacterium parmense]BBZ43498.1 hypothetical protein MPRM_07790 [Mycobacterium parmense]